MCDMAIPFNLPSDEETEDNYRRLDQLLVDLYHVLRQILLRPRYVPGPIREERERERGAEASAPRPVSGDVTASRRPDLPDVVSSAVSVSASAASCPCHCPSRRRPQPQRPRRRRRPRACCGCPTDHSPEPVAPAEPLPCPRPGVGAPAPDGRVENWLIIGEQLRKIAEEFKTTFKNQEVSKEKEEENLKMEVKTSGLFSLLVPSHFRSSLWTTVILLVGWRLLVRSR